MCVTVKKMVDICKYEANNNKIPNNSDRKFKTKHIFSREIPLCYVSLRLFTILFLVEIYFLEKSLIFGFEFFLKNIFV